uniref:uncharacterized protein LOC120887897 n=1 Tax=Ictidomys tridecemlineatus TaxID=43179 RepID=UPI001A9D6410|nr:uncharacterized protein LOC120887897 [Ictidomys tridecemlineatus]
MGLAPCPGRAGVPRAPCRGAGVAGAAPCRAGSFRSDGVIGRAGSCRKAPLFRWPRSVDSTCCPTGEKPAGTFTTEPGGGRPSTRRVPSRCWKPQEADRPTGTADSQPRGPSSSRAGGAAGPSLPTATWVREDPTAPHTIPATNEARSLRETPGEDHLTGPSEEAEGRPGPGAHGVSAGAAAGQGAAGGHELTWRPQDSMLVGLGTLEAGHRTLPAAQTLQPAWLRSLHTSTLTLSPTQWELATTFLRKKQAQTS